MSRAQLRRIRQRPAGLAFAGVVTVVAALLAPTSSVGAQPVNGGAGKDQGTAKPPKQSVATGYGGGVSSVDADATQAGLKVLRRGGNAVDAAVATAATLGVTEPFSSGIGGGGFFVYYDANSGEVHTIDGRETTPAAADEELFLDDDGEALPFEQARVSGRSVGVPGTPATWQGALDRWGSRSLSTLLQPAIKVADSGFTVDQTYADHIKENVDIFDDFSSSAELFLPDGSVPEVGSRFTNPDLARTYRMIAEEGVGALYDGDLGAEIADTVQDPPTAPDTDRTVRPGTMTAEDVSTYSTREQAPTQSSYRGLDVYGMAPSSSGGTTVGEALNILQSSAPDKAEDRADTLHRYLEAASLSFADRNRYVGDPSVVDVPTEELTSAGFGAERGCQITAKKALPKPVDPGQPDGEYADCGATARTGSKPQNDGQSTTHLTTADRWGNVVSYTLTIEQTGGSGIVVPDRGFLLNNELTDFNFEPTQGEAPDPNLPGPGKRPRSSMAPTIVLRDGEPIVAMGSPGGATIITTVLQTLLNRFDFEMSLPEAIAAPRASALNEPEIAAEPGFLAQPEANELMRRGHTFVKEDEIGAATGMEFFPSGKIQAAAEPERRGGGAAAVVLPVPRHP